MKEEWKNIRGSLWIKIVLLAIMVIPTLYACIFLGSMWDPYGNADKIPVAVVNQDKQVSYDGKNLNVGKELVKNLKENKAMDFRFVDVNKAKDGLHDGTYYMSIIIPSNFSSNATTLLAKDPKKMQLQYETNPGTNYIASKMDESAISKIKESISASVTKTYADTLFSQVKQLSNGLHDASDGTKKLGDGVNKTIAGNDEIAKNLNTLASSTLTFKDGAQTLDQGLQAYVGGVASVNTGAIQLATGIHTLDGKSVLLAGGVQSLQQGSQQLATGMNAYATGVQSLYQGAQQLSINNQKLNMGVQTLAQGSATLEVGSSRVNDGAKQLSDALQISLSEKNKKNINMLQQGNTLAKQNINTTITDAGGKIQTMITANTQAINIVNASALNPTDKAAVSATISSNTALLEGITQSLNTLDILSKDQGLLDQNNTAIQSLQTGLLQIQGALDKQGTTPDTMGLLQGLQQIQDGLTTMNTNLTGDQGLVNGIHAYTKGVEDLQAGARALNETSSQLQGGASQLQTGAMQLNGNIPTLIDGINQLTDGSVALQNGTNTLVGNNAHILQGVGQLQDGSTQISKGASQLATGSDMLHGGLVQLKDGTGTLDTALSKGAKEANVKVSDKTQTMLAQPVVTKHTEATKVKNNGTGMAPYMMSVGLYVACMAFTLMYPLLRNNSKTKSGFKMWLTKATVMYSISIVSAILMITALILINGLEPIHVLQTYIMAILIGAGFMSLIVFLNIILGKIGSFMVLIFMVMQLGGAAGTYPIETSGHIYNVMHPFMPFSYSVHAFRSTLANGTNLTPDILVFVGMLVVFSILSVLFYRWKVSISEEHFEKTPLAQFH